LIDAVNSASGNGSTAAKNRLSKLSVRTSVITSQSTSPTNGVAYFGTESPIARNQGLVSIDCIRNTVREGASGAFFNYVKTDVYAAGPAEYRLSGYPTSIYRSTPTAESGVTQSYQFFAPRPHLTVVGATVGYLQANGRIGSVLLDDTTNIAAANLYPSTTFHLLQFRNRFDRLSVLGDIYPQGVTSGGSTAGVTADPNLRVGSPTVLDPVTLNQADFRFDGIVLSGGGTTFSCNWAVFGTPGISGGQTLNVQFAGNSVVSRCESFNSHIKGWVDGGIADNSNVAIGELVLDQRSILDFAAVGYFDSWNFGTNLNCNVQGGIIFKDEESTIRGSNGIRLWNDQIVQMGQAFAGDGSKRQGSKNLQPTLGIG
jgi:hypothetical protein